MGLLQKHDWENYYPVHCKHCQWTGSSQFVQGDDDGPFYCPYCGMPDPTDSEISAFIFQFNSYFGYGFKALRTEVHVLIYYLLWRTFSLATQPLRLLYSRFIRYRTNRYWAKLNREIGKYWMQ